MGYRQSTILSDTNFLRFWLARTLSRVGDNFSLVAIAVYAMKLPNPEAAMSVLLISQLLPQLMSPIFGSLVDKRNPKNVMIFCDFMRTIAFMALFIFNNSLFLASLLILVSSLFSSIFNPASRVILPSLLSKEDIIKGNSLLSIGANAGIAIGPILAGILAVRTDFKYLFIVNSLSFLVSGILIYFVYGNFVKVDLIKPVNVKSDILEVVKYKEFKYVAFNLFIVAFFGSICHASLIFYNTEYLKGNAYTFGLLTSSYGLGMIFFPILLMFFKKELNPLTIITVAIIMLSISTSLMAVIPVVIFAVVMRFLMGGGNGILNIANDSLIQINVDKRDIGKVFGNIFFFPALSSIIALIINPFLLNKYKSGDIYMISGLLTIISLIPIISSEKNFKNIRTTLRAKVKSS